MPYSTCSAINVSKHIAGIARNAGGFEWSFGRMGWGFVWPHIGGRRREGCM